MDRLEGTQDRSMQDLLLLKMTVEGKDFQTARREVTAGLPAEEGRRAPDGPPAAVDAAEFAAITMDTVEFTAVSASLQTPQGALTYEAISLRATRIEVRASAQPKPPPKDPLLLDLDGDGPETTGQTGARSFDLGGEGRAVPTSFATGGDAFLALDRNGNGRIDDGRELFGDQHGAVHGFEELAKFDANGDGRIDGTDPVYGRLQLLHGDGSLTRLADHGVTALPLAYRSQGSTLASGDVVLAQGTAEVGEGRTLGLHALGLHTYEA